jgi:hypothetical protein
VSIIGKVGPFKYWYGGDVEIGKYLADDSIALRITDNGMPVATATVCLVKSGVPVEAGKVWLKGWGENEGIPEALEKAGIVKLTGKAFTVGYGKALEADLLVNIDQ